MIYKVRVRCIGEEGGMKQKKTLVRCVMAAIVEAESNDEAISQGVRHVENMAPVDVRWKEFNFMSCAPVALPVLAKDLRI